MKIINDIRENGGQVYEKYLFEQFTKETVQCMCADLQMRLDYIGHKTKVIIHMEPPKVRLTKLGEYGIMHNKDKNIVHLYGSVGSDVLEIGNVIILEK